MLHILLLAEALVVPTPPGSAGACAPVGRRAALASGAALFAAIATPLQGQASESRIGAAVNDLPDNEVVPSQMAQSDKIDLNNALVTDYKRLPGMYPHAAGQIASHGPYNNVGDLLKIKSANANDKKLFKKYEKEFVALPPGRMFNERINARQST
jgi:hypothetical protein